MGKATRKFEAWWCECLSFYSGEGPAHVYEVEPNEQTCHRMGDCGWKRVQLTKIKR